MYALLVLLVHGVISGAVAIAAAPYSVDPAATSRALWTLCMASALLSTIGFAATSAYLSKRVKPVVGAQVGLLCGLLCSAMVGLGLKNIQFSLVIYLALLVPTLAAVLLASLLQRSRSGWQS
jgi:hypothetical protein